MISLAFEEEASYVFVFMLLDIHRDENYLSSYKNVIVDRTKLLYRDHLILDSNA